MLGKILGNAIDWYHDTAARLAELGPGAAVASIIYALFEIVTGNLGSA
jgi:hypothetical protein